ncbi:hypothetical protein FIV02_17315 [Pseudomonas sp. THAF187a]|uniref:hypothetical protein n=1 Tax=unclassified Pseudomonas TaxID=196821 RepID=UPI0012685058|nr:MULTISPECIES: hypothetical protein [unclassified Pseudomonas]QFT23333.1 hypothetical protein FIV02_17315 [Pseudomonas sp. THAF187a]QFT43520.1 hypothetical protein FIU98_17295 [Pseudomonas sp. THAF42]
MNTGLVRLSQFVPEHASHHGIGLQEAAYDLRELVQALSDYYFESHGGELPEQVCWVGGATSSRRSAKNHMIDFESLLNYFGSWDNSPTARSPLFECYSESERNYTANPASCVYFSKTSMAEWILNAGHECPGFLLEETAEIPENDDLEGILGKELSSVQALTQGLAKLIEEVDRAHVDPIPNRATLSEKEVAEALKRAETIKRRASDLRTPRRSNSNPYFALIRLAEAAGVDLPRSHKTIEKYMEGKG